MADKRISQLIERTDIANNDVLPIVASGATTTNKVTISTIQDWMQDNLDVGVTSVGITFGTSGTDINASGSPVTSSGNITINLPTASATNRGALSSADWITFNSKQPAGNYVTLDTAQTITAQKTFTTSGSSDTMIISHGSGSGFALDVIKAGNNEAIRVTKTSGSGNAMSITGGNFSAEAATFSGVVTTTPDAVINGVNVGKGGGSLTTNTRLGSACLSSNTTGTVNTSVGYGSLQFNTIGSSNTSVGVNSLQTNTEGDANTSVGSNSLTANTTGDNNTSVGAVALYSNTSGTQNTATGAVALYFNTVGNSNTAVGLQSAYKNTTGNNNVAVGLNSLFGNTTGTSNVALGHGSGHYITDDITENSISNNSVFVGSQTKAQANNQTNQIVIGHNAIGNGSNTVTIGNDSITNTYLKGMVNAPNSVSILKKSDGFGGFTSNYLFLERGTSTTTSGVDGISLLSKPTGRALNVRYDIGGITYGAELNADLLDNSRTYQFPNASGTFALTSNLSSYLPLAGGTLTGGLGGTSASFSSDVQTSTRLVAANPGGSIILTPNLASTTNRIESTNLPLEIFTSGSELKLRAGAGNAQVTLASTGAVTLTGALNGTSAAFSSTASFLTNTGASTSEKQIIIANTGGSMRAGVESSSGGAIQIGTLAYAAVFGNQSNAATQFTTNGTARLTILGDGNVGIGTASPSQQFSVKKVDNGTDAIASFSANNLTQQVEIWYAGVRAGGTSTNVDLYLSSKNAGAVVCETNGTERMRITSGGFLKAKGTEPTYFSATGLYHEIRTGQGDEWTAVVSNASGAPYGMLIRYPNAAPNTNSYWFLECGDSSATRLRIASTGNVTNANNSYGALSDIKVKENITDASPKLDDLLKVKIRNYNLIGEETKQIGVIAQELEEVFPAMIDESEDFEEVEVSQLDEEGNEVLNEEGEVVTTMQRVSKGTTTKSVKYSVFVPMLIKAMQEQQEQIQELKTEIDSLKNQMQ
jgi:hypothetical protein